VFFLLFFSLEKWLIYGSYVILTVAVPNPMESRRSELRLPPDLQTDSTLINSDLVSKQPHQSKIITEGNHHH